MDFGALIVNQGSVRDKIAKEFVDIIRKYEYYMKTVDTALVMRD